MHGFLLIDYENMRGMRLPALPAEYQVLIFVGRSQHTIPFDLTNDAQQFGKRLKWIKIAGDGPNNLDFHLTYYLGTLSAEHKTAEFLILSKDKGFDQVLEHAVGLGVRCRRIESLSKIANTQQSEDDAHFQKALKVLTGIGKKARPRKQKTLIALVASVFQNKEPTTEIERIVNLFFSRNLITDANNALTYNF